MSLVVKSDRFRAVTAGADLDCRFQSYSDEGAGAVIAFAHYSRGRVLVAEDVNLVHGTQVQIPKHVAGGQARHQKFFRAVPAWIAAKTRIG